MTAKYGTPYFSNYINSDMQPSDVRSMCCRLRLDLRELRKKTGGFFGSGESTGSVGVVTINIPRIAYLAKDEDDFYERLDHMMDIAARSLKIKREVITKLLDGGLYPYTKRYLGTFENHFSTIGLIGMNEACLNARWIWKDLVSPEAQRFTKNVLNHMRDRLVDLPGGVRRPVQPGGNSGGVHHLPSGQDMTRKSIRISSPPGVRRTERPIIPTAPTFRYAYTADVFDALDIQDELQTLYTSGTVFHAFLGEKLPDWKAAAKLVRTIAENYKLPYYTLSPTYSICREHGYLNGEHFTCPVCGEKAEVYSRITGYYRPVQNWNDGKTQEYKERKMYDIGHSVLKRSPEASREIAQAIHQAREEIQEARNEGKAGNEGKAKEPSMIPQGNGAFLFTTKTCPNCKIAKEFLKDEQYQVVDAEENPELSDAYGIMQAPTLVLVKDGEIRKFVNASNIKKYVDSRKK